MASLEVLLEHFETTYISLIIIDNYEIMPWVQIQFVSQEIYVTFTLNKLFEGKVQLNIHGLNLSSVAQL